MMMIQSTPHDITPTLKIDKLVILADLPDPDGITEPIYHALIDAPTKAEFGLSPGGPRKRYKFSFYGFVPISTDPLIWSKTPAFFAELQPKAEGLPFMRLDLNPPGLTPEGRRHIMETFYYALSIDLAADLRHVAISRVDATIDLIGAKLDDWIFDRSGITKRQVFAGPHGTETLVFGGKHGSQTTVYDKKNQAKLAGPQITRIEHKYVKRQSPSALLTMANPFSKLLVASPAKIPSASPAVPKIPLFYQAAFAAHVRSAGLKVAVAAFPAPMAQEVCKGMAAAVPPWWKPASLWAQWPDVVKTAAPFLFTAPPKLGPFLPAPLTSPTPDGPVDYADAL